MWGIRPELFAVLSFLIFCFFLFSSSFWGGVLGTAVIIIVLLLGTFFGMTNTGQMSAVQKNWNKERYKEQESVLPEGQLTKAKKMKRTDEEALKVNIYKKNSYYLKGFVGTTYENNCWKASTNNWNIFGSDRSMLAASDREAYESLLWLHNKEFYGNTVMYHFVRQKKLSGGKTDPSPLQFICKKCRGRIESIFIFLMRVLFYQQYMKKKGRQRLIKQRIYSLLE